VRHWVLLVALLGAPRANATQASAKLIAARTALDAAQYQKAAELATQGLQAGDAGPEVVWALHALSAEISAVTGDATGAARSFSVVLSLNPSFRLRPGASPRIVEPFTRALERSTRRPIAHPHSLRRMDARHLTVSVEIQEDVLGVVEGARISGSGEVSSTGLRRVSVKPAKYEGTAECSAPCDLRLELFDEWGNTLAQSPLSESLLPSSSIANVSQISAKPERKLYQRPGLYLAAASAALVAASVYFGVRAQNEQRALLDINARRSENRYPEALSLDRARMSHNTYMWIGLGGAALTGVGAVWLW
jgi:hypothetical protein